MTTVFVYGTLKRGHGNWERYLKDNAEFIGKAVSLDKSYRMNCVGFPLLQEGGDAYVKGELFEVDDGTLCHLDNLEGHPRWYRREPRRFFNLDMLRPMTAEIYLQPSTSTMHGKRIRPRHWHVEWK